MNNNEKYIYIFIIDNKVSIILLLFNFMIEKYMFLYYCFVILKVNINEIIRFYLRVYINEINFLF